MANSFAASRAQLVFALCLPLAVLMGYFLAEPTATGSLGLIFLVFAVLCIPILMRWYHPMLVFAWNAAICPYFLPGQPYVWMILAFLGFGFAVTNRFTNPDARFVDLPSVNRALIFMAAVVLVTAWFRGGIGLKSLGGSSYGSKGYAYLLAAIAGYFAFISLRIPKHKAAACIAVFFLTGLTALIPNLAYAAGQKMMFLFYLFPPAYAQEQAMGEYSLGAQFTRIYGLTFGSNALYCWLLARYGLRGIFDVGRPLRLLLFVAATLGSLFCGFRSFLLMFILTVIAQFFFEKLYRGRTLVITAALLVLSAAIMIPNARHLPLVAQRSLSFLPLDISPDIRMAAENSSDWRVKMWKDVLPEIKDYYYLGKGYSINPGELDFAMENARRGYEADYRWAIVSGSYHNGPLTLIIPLGLWGVGAFLWFVIASIRYLYRNAKSGDPDLRTINTFLLAYFVARLVYFVGVFGSFYTDLFVFTGIMGVAVSLNGARQPEPATADVESDEFPATEELAPSR